MEQPSVPINLQVCPSCKKQSLMFIQGSNQYECLNTECRQTFFKASIDKFNQQTEEEKKALDSLTKNETKSWFGNQYYDPKKKKWRAGKRPKIVSLGHNRWLWIPIFFIVISIIVTVVLNYFYPGSSQVPDLQYSVGKF